MKNFSREIMNDDIRNKKIGTLLFIIHYEFLDEADFEKMAKKLVGKLKNIKESCNEQSRKMESS